MKFIKYKYNVDIDKSYSQYLRCQILVYHLTIYVITTLAIIYDDVLFENLDSKIKTDKVEFDLKTKDILVIMNDKNKKVKVTTNF